MTRHAATTLWRLLPAAFLLLGGCLADGHVDAAPGGDADPDDGPTPFEGCRRDRDGDGFGWGCANGPDCDDTDPSRALDCGADAEPCTPGEREECWTMTGPAEGTTLSCGAGQRECLPTGLWGACQVDEEFEKDLDSRALVGPVEPCNPCAPSCGRALDEPTDADLVPENSDDVEYNPALGGITIDDGTLDPTDPLFDADGDGVPDSYDSAPFDPGINGFTEFGEIFGVLPLGGPLVSAETNVEVRLRSADIYFLMDTTGSMQGEIDTLRTTLTSGNFVGQPEVCGLPPGSGAVPITNWTADYYGDSENLSGTLHFTRMEETIDHADWPNPLDPAFPGVDNRGFSVRFSRTVSVAVDGVLRVEALSDDGVRVRIDGAVVWDDGWRNQGPTSYFAEVPISAGTRDVAIEYYNDGGSGTIVASAAVVGTVPAQYEGLIGALSCQLADPAFAIGYFDDYPIDRYGYSFGDGACNDTALGTVHDLPFFQLLGSTPPTSDANRLAITGAVGKLSARCGDDGPESHHSALYAIASGAGMPDTRRGLFTPANTPPIVVDGSDIVGAPSPLVPINVSAPDPVFDVEYDAGDVTDQGRVFTGTTDGASLSHTAGSCNGAAPGAGDVAFRFELTADRNFVVSTQGSAFRTVVHVYGTDGSFIRCDEDDGYGLETSQIVFDSLPAGTYIAVIDGEADNEVGDYRIYLGPALGNDEVRPIDLGDLTNRSYQVQGNTNDDFLRNRTGSIDCWGGDKGSADDVVFRFEVTQPTNIVVQNAGTPVNSFLQLRNETFDLVYCKNGLGDEASIFQRLDPGIWYVVFSESGSGEGPFELGIGTWPDDTAYITAPGPTCTDGGVGGYPCFREGSVPIVVMFTDAEAHNGVGGDDRYSFGAPAYMDAVTALNRIGAKVIGIHSGDPPDVDCDTPCLEYEYNFECRDDTYCAEREYWTECWNETYCAERGNEVTTCEMRTFCQQGGVCWQEEVCRTSRPCVRYDTRERCRTRSRCIRTDTRTICEDRRGACINFGAPICNTDYEESHRELRRLASDTGTVDEGGEPFVYQINSDGSGLSEAVVRAIADLAGSFRMDISLRPLDNPATAVVDERDFIKQISTVTTGSPPPDTLTRCQSTEATFYRKCLPGTQAEFVLGLQNDGVVDPMGVDRIFEFDIEVVGEGIYILDTVRVNILVPAEGIVFRAQGEYWRDYDSQDHCGPSQVPVWGNFSWDADVDPVRAGTDIVFQFRTAQDPADLATSDVAQVIAPPTDPPVTVDTLLRDAGVPRNYRYLRATAVLRSSPNNLNTPVLRSFELQFECGDVD